MPARFRDLLGGECVVTTGTEHQLLIYTREAYRIRAEEINAEPKNREGNRKRMMFFSGADEQKIDAAGRLLLKQELRRYAGLPESGEVDIVGMFDHIALWEPQAFEAEHTKAEEVFINEE